MVTAAPPGVLVTDAGTLFRVWAPAADQVALIHESGEPGRREELKKAGDGYFEVVSTIARAGSRYRYELDGAGPYPDPCSRFQPDGPHGPSQLVDTHAFAWTDAAWNGVGMAGQVLYELHIGAFTPEGTFDAAARQLPELRDLGITVIEIMPVAEFAGRYNWGYDGVALFAPFHGYGEPFDFMRFVDAAHALGIAVILDVVYNHVGPDGNYLVRYSPAYFTDRYSNDWGPSLNFDGAGAQGARQFFLENVRYWIRDFHLDGLRLDATQNINDASEPHILSEIATTARAAAGKRSVLITAENEPQDARFLLPVAAGGFGFDAMWNDDFHHTARVAVTREREAYYTDYLGSAQEFVSAAKYGFLYQGQFYSWQNGVRGRPVTDQAAPAFIHFTQNHDQVGNTFFGQRLHAITSAARERALTAVLLLAPQTPLLFMGQEFASSSSFPFFADHVEPLRSAVHAGRRQFIAQFPSYAVPEAQARIADPGDDATFQAAKLDFSERQTHAGVYRLYKDLLALRRADPAIARQDRKRVDGAVLGEHCFVLRWFGAGEADRLLLVNLGHELHLQQVPEPLLAPPPDQDWSLLWSSDELHYGGPGVRPVYHDRRWSAPAEQATLLTSASAVGDGARS